MSDLNDILNGDDVVTEASEQATESAPLTEQNVNDDAGQLQTSKSSTTENQENTENSMGNENSAVPAEENTENPVTIESLQSELDSERNRTRGLEAAQTAERRKRQKAEDDAKKSENFWDDPENSLSKLEERFDQKISNATLNISERFARKTHDDFDEKMLVFKEIANANPSIIAQMQEHSDPAEFAYSMADQHKKMSDFGNIKNFEDKIRAEERSKFESEVEKRVTDKMQKINDLPGTLANVRTSGDGDRASKDNSLGGILGR